MSDIGNVAIALMHDGRLTGAASLQVVVSNEPHVLGRGRIADLLDLCRERPARERRDCGRADCERINFRMQHGDLPFVLFIIAHYGLGSRTLPTVQNTSNRDRRRDAKKPPAKNPAGGWSEPLCYWGGN